MLKLTKHKTQSRKNHWCWNSGDLSISKNKIDEKMMGDFINPADEKAELRGGKVQWHGKVVNFRRSTERDRHENAADEQSEHFNEKHYAEISRYKSFSTDINSLLRESYSEKVKKHTAVLDEVTNHKTPNKMVVYRGLSKHVFDDLKPGNEVTDLGYTGTSFKKHIAFDFADHHPLTDKKVVAKIHIPAGTRGHYIDHTNPERNHAAEREFLLHRGTRFKVLGHTEDGDHHYVHMQVVGNHYFSS